MKKHIFFLSIIIFLSLGFITSNLTKMNAYQTSTYENTTDFHYILKDYNGKIALFTSDREAPVEVYDIFTNSLPDRDAEKLSKGITASDEKELSKLLETYLS